MLARLQIQIDNSNLNDKHFNFETNFINRLRFHAAECRTSSHLDIFEACKLFDPENLPLETDQIDIFIRTLGQAMDHSPIWLKVGCKNFSFDECWLSSVFKAHRINDTASYSFLTRRRVFAHKRPIFTLMVANIINSQQFLML